MRLYEIDITSLWWFAADDEPEAMGYLREELYNREVSDEDIDDAMENLIVNELAQDEAEMIGVEDESLWFEFVTAMDPGLLHTDYYRNDEDDEEELEL